MKSGVSNFAAGLPSSVWSRNTAHTCQERRCAAPRYNEPGKPVAFARARAYVQIDSLSLYLCVTLCEPLHFPSSSFRAAAAAVYSQI